MVEILHEILVNFSVNLALIYQQRVFDGAALIKILDGVMVADGGVGEDFPAGGLFQRKI